MQKDMERLQQDRESRKAVAEKRAQERNAGRKRREAVFPAARQNLEIVISQSDGVARAGAKGLEEAIKKIELATKKREEATLQMEVAAKEREEGVQQMKAAAKLLQVVALAMVTKASEVLQRGIMPVVMPTLEQYSAAMERIEYNPEKVHFAVCGTSGSGKSTVINAVRGLGNRDHGAARVGVTTCTSVITRYPELRDQVPYSGFVWYDISSSGTTAVSDWQYFNDQGLFVFDFIILVYDVHFTAIDVGIIENCLRFNIPVFIVRSKADRHILNMMEPSYFERHDEEFDDVHREMARRYVEATRSDFDKHMQTMAEGPELDARDRQILLSYRVYIVSAATLRNLLQTTTSIWRGQEVDVRKIIDESLLIEDMLRAAARRRSSTKNPAQDVES